MDKIRTYSELRKLKSFEARFDYLKIPGVIGAKTFGFDRYLNQKFYTSRLWTNVRDKVIVRDNGLDLGFPDYIIHDRVLVHHMNPISIDDIVNFNPKILDPEYLICTSRDTHLAIHYGDKSKLKILPIDRRPGDTRLW